MRGVFQSRTLYRKLYGLLTALEVRVARDVEVQQRLRRAFGFLFWGLLLYVVDFTYSGYAGRRFELHILEVVGIVLVVLGLSHLHSLTSDGLRDGKEILAGIAAILLISVADTILTGTLAWLLSLMALALIPLVCKGLKELCEGLHLTRAAVAWRRSGLWALYGWLPSAILASGLFLILSRHSWSVMGGDQPIPWSDLVQNTESVPRWASIVFWLRVISLLTSAISAVVAAGYAFLGSFRGWREAREERDDVAAVFGESPGETRIRRDLTAEGYCPSCDEEFIKSDILCPDCGVPLKAFGKA